MDLRDTESDAAFRAELRAWLADVLPSIPPEPAPDDWAGRRAWDTSWQRMLFDAGYAGINWPVEGGGRGATPAEHLIFLEETERVGAPYVGMNFVGLLHGGPTLIAEGNAEQKAFHLPGILKGEHIWCQGFSEPSAGSDLASLRTKAVRDGDSYVVSGQKIWTSFAHVADYCELLVRTDPDSSKHKGITWLIMPMDLPGIDIRPLRTMAGSTEFCELFLDEVRIPVENRVGDENDGWRVTNVTLSFERGTAFVSEMLQSMELVRHLAGLAKRVDRWDDAGIRRELGQFAADLDALWALTKRNISLAARTGTVGLGGSIFKLHYAETRHRLGELAMRLLDRAALSFEDVGELASGRHVEGEVHAISISIAAGTSQIQRNIISERLLGLPPGASVDFELTSDQVDLQEGIRNLCQGRFPMERVHELEAVGGVHRSLWQELAETGVFALRLSEADGGLGLGMADAVLVFEQLGRALVPGPLVATELACQLAPFLAGGEEVVGLVERDRSPLLVEHFADLDRLLVVDDAGVWSMTTAEIHGAVPVERPLDPLTPLHLVPGVPQGEQLGDAGVAARLRREGAVLTAALLVGSAQAVTDLAVAFAKERQQFGRPIGSFQAMKHLLADMATRAAVAQAAVYAAGVTLDTPEVGDPDRAAAGAKVSAGNAAILNGKSAIQVHGGMGFTWEVDAHLHLKRAWLLDTQFGSVDHHAEAIAHLL